MKIVINDCYGGFCLSSAALDYYDKLCGNTEGRSKHDTGGRIPRHDVNLVKTVEDLGKEANGEHTHLVIIDVAHEFYSTTSYDGIESLLLNNDMARAHLVKFAKEHTDHMAIANEIDRIMRL